MRLFLYLLKKFLPREAVSGSSSPVWSCWRGKVKRCGPHKGTATTVTRPWDGRRWGQVAGAMVVALGKEQVGMGTRLMAAQSPGMQDVGAQHGLGTAWGHHAPVGAQPTSGGAVAGALPAGHLPALLCILLPRSAAALCRSQRDHGDMGGTACVPRQGMPRCHHHGLPRARPLQPACPEQWGSQPGDSSTELSQSFRDPAPPQQLHSSQTRSTGSYAGAK